MPPVNGQLGKVQERFIYDDQGRLAQSIDPRGNATKYEYDPRGLVIRTTDALGGVVETRYNAAGQAAWTRDAMGRITTTEYDALGRPIAVRDYGVRSRSAALATSASGSGAQPLRTSKSTYDVRGNLVSVIDTAGNTMRFIFDDRDRQIAVVQPEVAVVLPEPKNVSPIPIGLRDQIGPVSRAYYNADGSLNTSIDATGAWTTHQYDRLGRLTKTESSDGSRTVYSYNAQGHQDQVVDRDGNGTWTEWNPSTNTTLSGQVVRGYRQGQETLSELDSRGQLVRTTDPQGNITQYVYDELGRTVAEKIILSGQDLWRYFAYDAAGNLVWTQDRDGAK